jgi:hypothetical protein
MKRPRERDAAPTCRNHVQFRSSLFKAEHRSRRGFDGHAQRRGPAQPSASHFGSSRACVARPVSLSTLKVATCKPESSANEQSVSLSTLKVGKWPCAKPKRQRATCLTFNVESRKVATCKAESSANEQPNVLPDAGAGRGRRASRASPLTRSRPSATGALATNLGVERS